MRPAMGACDGRIACFARRCARTPCSADANCRRITRQCVHSRPLMEDILINITPQETRVAVLLAGVVQELHIERADSRGLVGNIYLGKVARVLPGMQSAFIDVGLERAAFLHVADIWENREPGKPIEK